MNLFREVEFGLDALLAFGRIVDFLYVIAYGLLGDVERVVKFVDFVADFGVTFGKTVANCTVFDGICICCSVSGKLANRLD